MNKISKMRMARLSASLTIIETCLLMKCSTATLFRYELGYVKPSKDFLKRLAAIYKCSLTDLTTEK